MKYKIKRAVASVLAIATIITTPLTALAAGTSYYSASLGSNLALGSPLSNNNFSAEDWDKWEMLAFGIFLGNYCKLGVDNYSTAFADGADGLKALQFTAGGDVNSNGILNKMLSQCKASQGTNLSQIQVKYSYYKYGEKKDLDLGMRKAKFGDLVPEIINQKDVEIKMSSQIDRPVLYADMKGAVNLPGDTDFIDKAGNYIESSLKNNWKGQLPTHDDIVKSDVKVDLAAAALLPELTVSVNGEFKTIFSLQDSYDASLMSAVMTKLGENLTEEELANLLNSELRFDAFGNICAFKDGISVLIIPAAANKNINKNKEVNLLNSLIINKFAIGSKETSMTTLASENAPVNKGFGSLFDGVSADDCFNGLPAVASNDNIKAGNIIMYADTDPLLIEDLYRIMRENNTDSGDSFETVESDTKENPDGEVSVDDEHIIIKDTVNLKMNTLEIEDLSYGKYIHKILDKDSLITAPFKLEVTGYDNTGIDFGWFGNKQEEENIFGSSQMALSMISNMSTFKLPEDSLTSLMIVNGGRGETADLFNGYYYLTPALSSNKRNSRYLKDFTNYGLKNLDKNNGLLDELYKTNNNAEIFKLITSEDSSEYSVLDEYKVGSVFKDFMSLRFNMEEGFENKNGLSTICDDVKDVQNNVSGLYNKADGLSNDYKNIAFRICKVYQPSTLFSALSGIYELDSNAMFETYTTNMYLSYLKWYGILDNKNDNDLRIDTSLFIGRDYLNLDPTGHVLSEEEKDKYIKEYTLSLLDPSESGRTFRRTMLKNTLTDGADDFYKSLNKGYLSALYTQSTGESWLTSKLGSYYILVIKYVIAAIFIVCLVYGIITKKKLIWLLASVGTTLLLFLAVPAYSDFTSVVCNNKVQKVFEENAMLWLLDDDIKNQSQAATQQHMIYNSGALDANTARQVSMMANGVRIQQSDKSFRVKLDISKKVVDQISIGWEELQRHASTRWLISSLMQMVGADDSNNYVYVTTHDWFSNMTRGYLAALRGNRDKNSEGIENTDFTPSESVLRQSFLSGEYTGLYTGGNVRNTLEEKQRLFKNYKDLSYTNTDKYGYRSTTRYSDDSQGAVHTYIYFMDQNTCEFPAVGSSNGATKEDWDNFADDVINKTTENDSFIKYNMELLSELNTYNRYESAVSSKFNNLWCTEGIGHYFYAVVKDLFPVSNTSVNYLAYQLAGDSKVRVDTKDILIDGLNGTIVPNNNIIEKAQYLSNIGNDVNSYRVSFMHQGDTGYVRDFLDLEEVFTNMIPYLYEEQLIMGGNDGTSGVLGNDSIRDKYSIYQNNLQSWLYRSNWVTKLMADGKYSGTGVVFGRTANGDRIKFTVENMIDPRCYPVERPMIFSEAQQKYYGLEDADLNYLELKLVKINNDVCDEWTMLINYVNTANLKTENLERIMTTIATLKFNSILSENYVFKERNALYPMNIDLSNITWDTLVRHMMVGSAKDEIYLTEDNLIRTTLDTWGIFCAGAILGLTFLINIVFPLVKNVTLAILFIMSVFGICLSAFSSGYEKLKVCFGWMLTYLSFTGLTCLFYRLLGFAIGTNISNPIVGMESISWIENPASRLFLVIIALIFYIIIILAVCKLIISTYGLRGFAYNAKYGGVGGLIFGAHDIFGLSWSNAKEAFKKSLSLGGLSRLGDMSGASASGGSGGVGGAKAVAEQLAAMNNAELGTEKKPVYVVIKDSKVDLASGEGSESSNDGGTSKKKGSNSKKKLYTDEDYITAFKDSAHVFFESVGAASKCDLDALNEINRKIESGKKKQKESEKNKK